MQERHKDRNLYFAEQEYTTRNYVIPFIAELLPITSEIDLLEIGCGEGGNIKPFLDIGCNCVGIDLSSPKIELGKQLLGEHTNSANLELFVEDIYKVNRTDFKFDVIILRDVIEHIYNQEKFMEYVKKFLKPDGKIFFAFPPWHNPFGGHQQIGHSKISLIPFIHLLPQKIYKKILEIFEKDNILPETNDTIVNELMSIKETRITIERFHRILKQSNYKIEKETLYLINPNYEVKFNLKPRKLLKIFAKIPYIRNFYTTAVYCIVSI